MSRAEVVLNSRRALALGRYVLLTLACLALLGLAAPESRRIRPIRGAIPSRCGRWISVLRTLPCNRSILSEPLYPQPAAT